MRTVHIGRSDMNLDYQAASRLAASLADGYSNIVDPVIVAWRDKKASRVSPTIGDCAATSWHDYGETHGGKLEVDVNGEFDFIFADSSAFASYGPSPYVNLHDPKGNEYLCQTSLMRDRRNPLDSRNYGACMALDEWTSKLT